MYFVQKPSAYPLKWDVNDATGENMNILSPQYGDRFVRIIVKPSFVTFKGPIPLNTEPAPHNAVKVLVMMATLFLCSCQSVPHDIDLTVKSRMTHTTTPTVGEKPLP